MFTMKKVIGSLITLTLFVGAYAQVDPNRTVVTVNGEDIKASEYYSRMEFLPDIGRLNQGNFVEGAPGFLTIERLIEERILVQTAKDKKVYPGDADVNAAWAERLALNPTLEADIASSGLTKDYVLHQIRLELCQFRLQTMGVTITDLEVEKHYKENPTRFSLVKRFDLSLIAVTTDEEMSKVDAELGKGTAFGAVARSMSQDPSAGRNGAWGEIPETMLGEAVKKELANAKTGTTTKWVKGEGAWVKFYVHKVMPAEKLALDAKLKSQIRKDLMLAKGINKNDVSAMLRETRKKAVIVLKQPQFASSVKRLIDRYKLGG